MCEWWASFFAHTHFLSASSIANASWWRDAHIWGERALMTFNVPQTRPSSYRGTSRRSLITSWTTLIQDIRGTLHWFHSRELLCMLSVDKLYFKTFHNERLLPGDGPLIGYAQCATYYHKRKKGDWRARPWVPKVLSWQTYRWNDFVQQQPESSSTRRHSKEWFYHDRTESLNRYIPRHSQHVAWGSTTRSIEGQTLPHENNKILGLPCLVREAKSTGRSAYWADTSTLFR